MLTARDIACLLGLPLRTAQARLTAWRREGLAVKALRSGARGRPRLGIAPDVLAARLGVPVGMLTGEV